MRIDEVLYFSPNYAYSQLNFDKHLELELVAGYSKTIGVF
jgi:hypothetical protein